MDNIFRNDRSVLRPADRRSHLPQRAPGAALRHHRREGRPVPRVQLTQSARYGLLGKGGVLMLTCLSEPHLAGAARRLCARAHHGHAAAAAAAAGGVAEGEPGGREAQDRARADGEHIARSRSATAAMASSIRSASRSRTSTPSASPARSTASRATEIDCQRRAAGRHDRCAARTTCARRCSPTRRSSCRRSPRS